MLLRISFFWDVTRSRWRHISRGSEKFIAFIFSIDQPTLKIWPQMLKVILPIWLNMVGHYLSLF